MLKIQHKILTSMKFNTNIMFLRKCYKYNYIFIVQKKDDFAERSKILDTIQKSNFVEPSK